MDTIQSAENVASLAATLDLARQFAGEVGGVPVEIVEASGQAGVLGETNHDGGQTVVAQGDALEIMSSSLSVPSVAPSSMASGMAQVGPLASSNDMVQQLAAEGIAGTHAITLAGPPLPTTDNNGGAITSTADLAVRLGVTLDNNLEQQLQHVSQSAMQTFQEVSRSLRSEGIEISPEAIADSLAASITHSQATPSASSILESAMSQSSRGLMGMNYSDLTDMTRVINSSMDPQLSSRGEPDRSATAAISQSSMESVLNESEVIPSSPESNFDTNELLNNISHRDDLMSKLASTGPVGVAAAAAIVSSRKRKRHSFESNPALRKRHCSKLMRRLRETLDELSTRVGLQTCVVTYRPSAKTEKPDPVFKVFGTSPLIGAIENQKEQILTAMDESLRKQAPPISLPPQPKQALFELPPLVFDGIPTPINEMTQAQLRAFIPGMLKFSTGRGKPGWGKTEMRPSWWPDDIPWQNVRSDVRTDEQKKAMSWTDALRRILTTCYIHHGRTDLLTQFTSTSQQQEDSITAEAEEQLRMIQQQSHELDLAALQHSVTSVREGGVEDVDPSLVENHQVFTIDTGMGNCDTTGMPTLADASLAETAARLQQVADETGQVQYATQTVTVTDRDAKALGQPVGSTTTVLLTAYPSGHGPPSGPPAATSSQQQLFPPASSSSSTAQLAQTSAVSTAPSVQVVYSASHVSELPDSIMSGIGPSSVSQDLYSQTDAVTSAVEPMDTTVTDSSDYLTSPQVMVAAAAAVAQRNDPCSIADLASQYINQYAGSLEPPSTDTPVQLTDPTAPTQDI